MEFQRWQGGILNKTQQQIDTGSWNEGTSKIWERLVLFINCKMCRGLQLSKESEQWLNYYGSVQKSGFEALNFWLSFSKGEH